MKILATAALCLGLASCTASTSEPENNTTVTPSSTSYFKVDGISSSVSADKANASEYGFRVTKAFELGADGRHNAALNVNMKLHRDSVVEGHPRTLYVTLKNYTDSKDSVMLYTTMDFYPKGVYELQATTGKLLLSKIRDTVQLTSVGSITVTGKNTISPFETQTRTVDFNIRDGVSF